MSDPISFIKLQLSNGVLCDKDDDEKIIGHVWIFRKDIDVDEQHWFEPVDIDTSREVLCIKTGSDKFPISCTRVFLDSDGPSEWEPLDEDEILKCLKFCCQLVNKKNDDDKIQRLGSEIIEDALSGGME
jgi:hypothetical protein